MTAFAIHFHRRRSPTPASPSTAATPAPKTSESSSATAPASGTSTEATSTHRPADEWAEPPAPAAAAPAASGGTSNDGPDDVKDKKDQEKNQPEGDRSGTAFRPRSRLGGLRCGERDASISGDVSGELPGACFDTGAVISLAEERDHSPAGVTGAGVVDDGLEAVADFCPIFVFERGDEKENAAIVFFAADADLLEEFVAVLLDGFAFERADGDDGHLRAGFLLELGTETFEAGGGRRSDDVGEIGDVAGGTDVLDFFGGRSKGKHGKEK